MASVRKLESGKWQGRYRDASGKWRSAGVWPREKQALAKAQAAEDKERANPTDVESQKITWGEWEPRWESARRVAESTKGRDRGRLEKHVRPKWAHVKLKDITTHGVQVWLRELEDGGLAPSTVIKCYHLLSSSLKAAVAARMIDKSPCVGVVLPKSGSPLERYLTDEEVRDITYHMSTRDTFAVHLFLGTGVRLGEGLGLHWESVDLAHNTVAISRSWDPVGQQIKSTKKLRQSNRSDLAGAVEDAGVRTGVAWTGQAGAGSIRSISPRPYRARTARLTCPQGRRGQADGWGQFPPPMGSCDR